MTAREVIARLALGPHPEGGHYRQTWAAGARPGERPSGTAILFLLARGERSHWHRVVDADEIWHFHAGAPLALRMAPSADGPVTAVRLGPDVLGPDVLGAETPQAVVPAGWWQAAATTGDWTLVGCTVSPGFVFDRFELAPPGFDIP